MIPKSSTSGNLFSYIRILVEESLWVKSLKGIMLMKQIKVTTSYNYELVAFHFNYINTFIKY